MMDHCQLTCGTLSASWYDMFFHAVCLGVCRVDATEKARCSHHRRPSAKDFPVE
jgi:hypothetical protein